MKFTVPSLILFCSTMLLLLPQNTVAFSIKTTIETSTSTSTSTTSTTPLLQKYQQTAGQIASSFEPREFKPVPWLSNCHIQTIGGVFLRQIPECSNVVNIGATMSALVKNLLSSTAEQQYWDRRERIETPDGDWFHVDWKDNTANTNDEANEANAKGLMILIHGLESSSESPLVVDMAKAYQSLNLDVCCINFRGCSGTPNDTLGAYHLGFTNDLKQLLDIIIVKNNNKNDSKNNNNNNNNQQPLYLSGFSLGGNMMIKALGELQETAVDKYNIRGAAVFCAPLNAERHYKRLYAPGINRSIYTGSLLKTMKQKAHRQMEVLCDGNPDTTKFNYKACMAAETIFDFEDAFIAPIYGFDDPIDYFRQTASINFIETVAVPTFVLNGEDDPFMDGSYQPTNVCFENGGRAPVKMIHSKLGGHCGFIFHQVDTRDDDDDDEQMPLNSFGPAEMKRFIQHVMDNNDSKSMNK